MSQEKKKAYESSLLRYMYYHNWFTGHLDVCPGDEDFNDRHSGSTSTVNGKNISITKIKTEYKNVKTKKIVMMIKLT